MSRRATETPEKNSFCLFNAIYKAHTTFSLTSDGIWSPSFFTVSSSRVHGKFCSIMLCKPYMTSGLIMFLSSFSGSVFERNCRQFFICQPLRCVQSLRCNSTPNKLLASENCWVVWLLISSEIIRGVIVLFACCSREIRF